MRRINTKAHRPASPNGELGSTTGRLRLSRRDGNDRDLALRAISGQRSRVRVEAEDCRVQRCPRIHRGARHMTEHTPRVEIPLHLDARDAECYNALVAVRDLDGNGLGLRDRRRRSDLRVEFGNGATNICTAHAALAQQLGAYRNGSGDCVGQRR